MNEKEILEMIKDKRAKAVFVEKFPNLNSSTNVVTESLIYFKPKFFGKSTFGSVNSILNLKTKEDCEKLNQELFM